MNGVRGWGHPRYSLGYKSAPAEKRELCMEYVLGFERLGSDQNDGKPGIAHGLLNVIVPIGTDTDFPILPDIEQVLLLEHSEMPDQLRLPLRAIAPMTVADKEASFVVVHNG